MANLLFASRESDSLRSENPGRSQPSRGLVLAPYISGRRCRSPRQRRPVRALDGFRHLVEDVGCLVKPAPLGPGGGPDLVEGLPEAERPVADRDLGRDSEAAGLQIDEKLAPALRALPDANLETDELLPPLGRGADEDEHAFGVILHSGLQVDAISPDVEVAPGREVAPLPTLILGLPFGREAGDDGG